MAIALVQSPAPNTSFSGSPIGANQAFPSPNIAGNMILVYVFLSSAQNTDTDTISVSDSNNPGPYKSIAPVNCSTSGASGVLQVFYLPNCKAGNNTVTVTSLGGISNAGILAIREVSGVDTLDVSSPGNGTAGGAVTLSTGTVNTNHANEFAFAAFGMAISAGSVSSVIADGSFILIDSGVSPARIDEYQVLSSTTALVGNTDITLAKSSSISWAGQLATFYSSTAVTGRPRIHIQNGRTGRGPHPNWEGPVG